MGNHHFISNRSIHLTRQNRYRLEDGLNFEFEQKTKLTDEELDLAEEALRTDPEFANDPEERRFIESLIRKRRGPNYIPAPKPTRALTEEEMIKQ